MRKGYGEGPSDIKMIFFCILSSIINDIYIYMKISALLFGCPLTRYYHFLNS